MRDYYYLTHSQQVLRISSGKRPLEGPETYTYHVADYDGWRKGVSYLTYPQLQGFTYIGSIRRPKSQGFAD